MGDTESIFEDWHSLEGGETSLESLPRDMPPLLFQLVQRVLFSTS